MRWMDMLLEAESTGHWYNGIHVSEAMELLLVFVLFVGTLAAVYFVQRWIGDY